jgi:tetratricopeptide (TPR) repeat protein
VTDIRAIHARGLKAVEEDDVEAAQEAIDAIQAATGPEDPARLHLEGVFAWACGDLDAAEDMLADAAERPGVDPRAIVHFGELVLARLTRLGDAEAALRGLVDTEGSPQQDEARLLLAQVRLADEDPEEALELLEGKAPEEHVTLWAGTRAEALSGLGKHEAAVAELRALAGLADDSDLQYLLGAALLATEDASERDAAHEAWVLTLALDREDDEEYERIAADEIDALKAVVEDTMGSLPQPVLERLAQARVDVVERVSDDEVRAGADPRGFVVFVGEGLGEAAQVDRVVVQRNVLLDVLESDEEVPEALVHGLAEEIGRVFEVELIGGAG